MKYAYDVLSTIEQIQTTEWKDGRRGEKCLQAFLTIVAVDSNGEEHIGQYFAGVEILPSEMMLPNIEEIKDQRKKRAVLELFALLVRDINNKVNFPGEGEFIMIGFLPYKDQGPGKTVEELGIR